MSDAPVEQAEDRAPDGGETTGEGSAETAGPAHPRGPAPGQANRPPERDEVPPESGPTAPSEPSDPPAPVADYRLALVASVTVDLPNQHPTVVLRETESPRRQLSFSVGFQDGAMLSHAMRRIATPRPLTHELLSQVLQGFDIDVVAVRIVGRQGTVYFAELDLRGRSGRRVLSCRPSDGLTVALLHPVSVPLLVDGRLFELEGDVTPPGQAPGQG